MARGGRGRPSKSADRPSRRPRLAQNARKAPGAFDPKQSRIKAVEQWDQDDLDDDEDDFFAGKDKVLLEHNRLRDDGDELDLPDEVLALKSPDQSDEDDEEAHGEDFEVPERIKRARKTKKVDTAPKGRFAKPPKGDDDEDEDEDGSDGSDEDDDEDEMVIPDVDLPSDESASAAGSSEDEEEAWRSYHVSTKPRRGKRGDDEADEAEDHALELAEVERLRKKARARLVEADFLPYGGALPLYPTTEPTEDVETFTIDRSRAPVGVSSFASEPEAIAHLLKHRPEALALVDDFKRQLKAFQLVEKEVKGVKAIMAAQDDEDMNETNEAINWLHYHSLSTYLSCVAFYFRVLLASPSLSAPSNTPSLLDRITITISSLRKSLSTLEDQVLGTGPSDAGLDDLLGESEDEDAEETGLDAAAKLEIMQQLDGMGQDELRELLAAQLEEDADQEGLDLLAKAIAKGKSKGTKKAEVNGKENGAPPKKRRRSRKRKTSTTDATSQDALLSLDTQPPAPVVPEDPTSSLADDFLDPLALSAASADDKANRRRALRFHTAKIAAKEKRREAATGGGKRGAGQGDDDLVYKTREERRREVLKRQRHDGADEATEDAEPTDSVGGADEYYDLVKELKDGARKAKKAKYDENRLAERDVLMSESQSNGPRSASRAILSNRGLTPKRSKLNRNPRVKKRVRFDKAKQKVSSQRAVYKGAEAAKARSGGYEGEKTGIRGGIVKSRKL